ncbi:hypothetical protein ASG35_11610 [Burkholderia sp. Leaf177]|nr:hypothetical protein ASG35_11610 [Burkholderia sp. Leaf177]
MLWRAFNFVEALNSHTRPFAQIFCDPLHMEHFQPTTFSTNDTYTSLQLLGRTATGRSANLLFFSSSGLIFAMAQIYLITVVFGSTA